MSGQVEGLSAFDSDGERVPGVRSYGSAGHTAGHTSYVIESQGHKLLLVGDLIHVPAVQLDHPEVTFAFDYDAQTAKASRAKLFNEASKERTLVGASHIQFPGLGHLQVKGKGYQWVPVNFTQMR